MHLNQWMATLDQLQLLLLIHHRHHVEIVSRHLCEGCQNIELGHDRAHLLKQGIVGRSYLEHLLDELILLDLVLILKFHELAD